MESSFVFWVDTGEEKGGVVATGFVGFPPNILVGFKIPR